MDLTLSIKISRQGGLCYGCQKETKRLSSFGLGDLSIPVCRGRNPRQLAATCLSKALKRVLSYGRCVDCLGPSTHNLICPACRETHKESHKNFREVIQLKSELSTLSATKDGPIARQLITEFMEWLYSLSDVKIPRIAQAALPNSDVDDPIPRLLSAMQSLVASVDHDAYERGVDHGQDLLRQLNEGRISPGNLQTKISELKMTGRRSFAGPVSSAVHYLNQCELWFRKLKIDSELERNKK